MRYRRRHHSPCSPIPILRPPWPTPEKSKPRATNLAEAYRLQAGYAGRILKGEKTTDLPVVQLSKFDLVINLKTAKALGLSLPPGVLARRRRNRIAVLFAAAHESASGTTH